MKKMKELITKEEMKRLVKFNNELSGWLVKDFEHGSVERQWCIKLVQELNRLNDEYKAQTVVDASYLIYHTKHFFENVKELYRNTAEKKYKKVYEAWEILFDAYTR